MPGEKSTALCKKLTEEISSGKFAPLGAIPSERALMARFNVSRETVRKALRMLEEMGLVYVSPGRGTFASGGGRGQRSIGVLVSGCRYTEIFKCIGKAVCARAKDNGLNVIFEDASSLDSVKALPRAVDFARQLVAMKVDGVIVQPMEFVPDAEEKNLQLMSMFKEAQIPVVLLDCDVVAPPGRSDYDKVGIDNIGAGWRVGAHLAECGAKCVLCCASPFFPGSVRARFDGVRMVCPDVLELEAAADEFSKLRRVFREHPEVDAVVCQNDVYAIGVMASLRKMKKRIPDDVMVVGFDGLGVSKISSPALTTISQPVDDIAAAAYDRLLHRMDGRVSVPAEINLSAPLVVQKSTIRKAKPL